MALRCCPIPETPDLSVLTFRYLFVSLYFQNYYNIWSNRTNFELGIFKPFILLMKIQFLNKQKIHVSLAKYPNL